MRTCRLVAVVLGALPFLLAVSGASLAQPSFTPYESGLRDADLPISPMPVTRADLYRATQAQGMPMWEGSNIAHGALNDGMTFAVLDRLEGVELPHCTWAQPFAGGRLKVLVFAYTAAAAEIVDLGQRLDGELYVGLLPLSTAGGFGSPWLSQAQQENFAEIARTLFLKRLREVQPDVLVVHGTVTPAFQAADLAQEISERVRKGMGLVVLLSPKNTEPVLPEVPLQVSGPRPGLLDWLPSGQAHAAWSGVAYRALPQLNAPAKFEAPPGFTVVAQVADIPYLVTGTLGEGRIAALPWGTTGSNNFYPEVTGWSRETYLTPPQEYRLVDDICGAFLKVIHWAARKDSGLVFTVECPPETDPEAELPVTIEVAAAPPEEKCTLHLEVQNERRETVHSVKQAADLRPGLKLPLTLPALRCRGRYWVDVVARDAAERSLGWASAVTEIKTGPELMVTLDGEVLRPGQPVAGKITVGGWEENRPATLTIELWDSWGRLVARTAPAPVRPETAFRFDLRYCPAQVLAVVARLEQDRQTLAYAEREVTVPEFGPSGDYRVSMWLTNTRRMRTHLDLLRRSGFDGIVTGPWGPPLGYVRAAAWANLSLSTENGFHSAVALGTVGGGNTAPNPDNWPGQPKYEKLLETTVDPWAAVLRRYGCRVLSLANESWPAKTLVTEPMRAAFRQYLQQEYGDLARLNAQWDTNFTTWEQVEIPPLQPGTMNFSPELEVQQFIRKTAGREQGRAAERYFSLMGQRVPWGTTSSGFSIYQAEAGANLYGGNIQYGPILGYDVWNRATMPFAKVGFEEPEKNYTLWPWKQLFNGSQTEWHYLSGGSVALYGAFNQRGLWVKKHEQEIRDGLGKLLVTSELQRDPVALLYEENSHFVDYSEWGLVSLVAGDDPMDQQTYVRLADSSRKSFEALFKDAQLRPRWLSEKMVQQGALRDIRLLVLCANFCLAADTARAIEQWVQEGGIVVADLLPGAYDEKGKWRGQGPLDALFGIERSGLQVVQYPPEYTVGILESIPGFLEKLSVEWFFVQIHEGQVRATEGKALGRHFTKEQAPAFVFRRHGRGAALYLNYLDTDYIRSRDPRHLRLAHALLEQAGITAPLRVLDPVGQEPVSGLEITRFADDQATHVGVIGGNGQQVVVKFDRESYLYDTRKHQLVGKGREFFLTFTPDFPRLLSFMPCRIDGIKVSPPVVVPRGQVAGYQIAPQLVGPPTSLVYRIEFTDPTGTVREAYRLKVRAPQGRYAGLFQPALNDPVGAWKLTVTEVISGKSATATFQVK